MLCAWAASHTVSVGLRAQAAPAALGGLLGTLVPGSHPAGPGTCSDTRGTHEGLLRVSSVTVWDCSGWALSLPGIAQGGHCHSLGLLRVGTVTPCSGWALSPPAQGGHCHSLGTVRGGHCHSLGTQTRTAPGLAEGTGAEEEGADALRSLAQPWWHLAARTCCHRSPSGLSSCLQPALGDIPASLSACHPPAPG